MRRHLFVTTALTLALLAPMAAGAQEASDAQATIYGSQLMTPQERVDYRQRMRSATSAEEQAQVRADHHQVMQQRAHQLGKSLPDEPPARGMGAGKGPGKGMGPGQGRGMTGTGQGMGPGGGGRGRGG